jgi:hypothetical protein
VVISSSRKRQRGGDLSKNVCIAELVSNLKEDMHRSSTNVWKFSRDARLRLLSVLIGAVVQRKGRGSGRVVYQSPTAM